MKNHKYISHSISGESFNIGTLPNFIYIAEVCKKDLSALSLYESIKQIGPFCTLVSAIFFVCKKVLSAKWEIT